MAWLNVAASWNCCATCCKDRHDLESTIDDEERIIANCAG